RRRAFCRPNLPEQVDQSHVGLDRFGRKTGHDRAEVGAVEPGALIYLAGEKPRAQRTERNEADAERFDRGQDFCLRAPVKKGILTLHGCERLYRVRTADCLRSGLGETEMLDLACLDEFLDRTGDLLDWH